MRGKLLLKLHKALKLIERPQGTSVQELRLELGIDRSSVYRLLHTIEEMGYPLYDERLALEKSKRWKLLESSPGKRRGSFAELRLSRSELIALNFIRGYARLYIGTDLEEDINSAFDKVMSSLSPQLAAQLKKFQSLFLPNVKFAKDYSGKDDIIDSLTEAILEQKTCRIRYHSFSDDRRKKFLIDPLHFFEHRGGLYLFANATDFGNIRTLAVERIEEVEITQTGYNYPEGFDPEKWLGEAFTLYGDEPFDARIWFSSDQARYIKERTWAKQPKIIDNEDGSIILEMSTSGKWDVMRWVLGFGSQAEVLEPADLREETLAELDGAWERYHPGLLHAPA